MKRQLTAIGLLALTTACAEVQPTPFDGRLIVGSQSNAPLSATMPPAVPLPGPDPITSRSLDGGTVTPRPSTNGMAPPPVEIGVVSGVVPPPPPADTDASSDDA